MKEVAPRGVKTTFGLLPTQYVWIESRRLEDKAGYIAFNMFLDPARITPAFEQALKDFAHTDGVVIDIRGNPGGIGIMAPGLAGWLIDKPGQRLGTMITREGPLNLRGQSAPSRIQRQGRDSGGRPLRFHSRDLRGRASGFETGAHIRRKTAGAALPSFLEKPAQWRWISMRHS